MIIVSNYAGGTATFKGGDWSFDSIDDQRAMDYLVSISEGNTPPSDGSHEGTILRRLDGLDVELIPDAGSEDKDERIY